MYSCTALFAMKMGVPPGNAVLGVPVPCVYRYCASPFTLGRIAERAIVILAFEVPFTVRAAPNSTEFCCARLIASSSVMMGGGGAGEVCAITKLLNNASTTMTFHVARDIGI